MILTTTNEKDYELIDSGEGEKLERFGKYILRRPDPEVLWRKNKTDKEWENADAYFKKDGKGFRWEFKGGKIESWTADFLDLNLLLKIGNFKHIGVFPEQISQWKWMTEIVNKRKSEKGVVQIRILNLFGYTGGASLALAKAGAEVTHIDASKSSILWANQNKENVGLESHIRFLLDDARKFVEKELRRGVVYDAILMDPPVYGTHGKREKGKWHLEEDFLNLLERTTKLLSKNPLFFVISGYASEYSHVSYKNALTDALQKSLSSGIKEKMNIESGELGIKESDTERVLPAGIFVRANFS